MTNAVTRLNTLLHGKIIGTDYLGNKYYAHKKKPEKRWVVFAERDEDASQVPPAWHSWLHHTSEKPPNDGETLRFRHAWQKKHQQNLTASKQAFLPSSGKIAEKPYSPWKPNKK